ncbi:hypothetical protein ACCI51_03390 [Microbulbifer echini]|uniref:Uncharacterized protein n=2 Tax=Microbulbifer echini TaxID=1529067 RepID=A0ABV4NJR7_9GAMM
MGRYINPPFEYKESHSAPMVVFASVLTTLVISYWQHPIIVTILERIFCQMPSSRKFFTDNYLDPFQIRKAPFGKIPMDLWNIWGRILGVFMAMYFDPNRKDGYIILMNRDMDGNSADAMRRIASRLMQM